MATRATASFSVPAVSATKTSVSAARAVTRRWNAPASTTSRLRAAAADPTVAATACSTARRGGPRCETWSCIIEAVSSGAEGSVTRPTDRLVQPLADAWDLACLVACGGCLHPIRWLVRMSCEKRRALRPCTCASAPSSPWRTPLPGMRKWPERSGRSAQQTPDHPRGVVHHRDDTAVVDPGGADHADRADDPVRLVARRRHHHRQARGAEQPALGADE